MLERKRTSRDAKALGEGVPEAGLLNDGNTLRRAVAPEIEPSHEDRLIDQIDKSARPVGGDDLALPHLAFGPKKNVLLPPADRFRHQLFAPKSFLSIQRCTEGSTSRIDVGATNFASSEPGSATASSAVWRSGVPASFSRSNLE